jgi:hypothetical protein
MVVILKDLVFCGPRDLCNLLAELLPQTVAAADVANGRAKAVLIEAAQG